jgi:hypothetical protein
MGTALTIAAGELAATYSDLTWLHCTPRSRDLYKRLGYDHIGHALLVVDPDEPAVALTLGEDVHRGVVVGRACPFDRSRIGHVGSVRPRAHREACWRLSPSVVVVTQLVTTPGRTTANWSTGRWTGPCSPRYPNWSRPAVVARSPTSAVDPAT